MYECSIHKNTYFVIKGGFSFQFFLPHPAFPLDNLSPFNKERLWVLRPPRIK